MRALVLILMISFPLLCHAGEIYKWRDKDGNIHYSDVEPAKQAAERKVVKPKHTKPLTSYEIAEKARTDKAANCETAKKNYSSISNASNARVMMDLNNDGKAEVLTPEQRSAQTELMKAAVTIDCAQ